MHTTIQILESTHATALKNLQSFQKKCIKYGKNLFTYTFSDPYHTIMSIDRQKFDVMAIDINLNFQTEKLIDGDYKVIAKLEKTNDKNFIDLYDTLNYSYDQFETADFICEHCKSNRKRKYIYVLENISTGEVLKVGKSCLNDFMNDQNALQKIAFLDAYSKLCTMQQECIDEIKNDSAVYFENRVITRKRFLKYLLLSIKQNGFISSKDQRSDKECTASNVLKLISRDYLTDEEKEIIKNSLDEVEAIITFYENLSKQGKGKELNEFMYKLAYLMNQQIVRIKDIKILVYAYNCYQNELNAIQKQQEQVQQLKAMDFIGKVGDKIEVLLKVESIKIIDGFYGSTYLYTFKDQHNNIVSWFASKKQELQQEQEYKIKGTVKEHKYFNNTKQTLLTRCKIA